MTTSLLAPGERARLAEPHGKQERKRVVHRHELRPAGRAGAEPEAAQEQVFLDGEVGEDVTALGNLDETPADALRRRVGGDVVRLEEHLSAARGHEARDDPEQRALSGVVRAEDRHALARRDREVDLVEHGHLAVTRGDASHVEQHADAP